MKVIKFTHKNGEVELDDTTELQCRSIQDFASELGYFFDRKQGNFELTIPARGAPKFRSRVRLDTMQEWHNTNFYPYMYRVMRGSNIYRFRNLGFTDINSLESAILAKWVNKTKLQINRKTKKLIVQDHQVVYLKGEE